MKHWRLPILVLLVLLCSKAVDAQTPDFGISDMLAVLKGSNKFLEVTFTKPLDAAHAAEDLAVANVKVEALPSAKELKVNRIDPTPGEPDTLTITLTGDAMSSDVQVKLTINRIMHFIDGATAREVTGPFTFTSTLIKDAKTRQDAMQKLVEEMGKGGKPSLEKNIFASGFVTTASGGDTQGGADIHLNSLDLGIPGLKSFLIVRKTTADGSDPKNFEAGGTFRSTVLRGKAERADIQNAMAAYRAATKDEETKAAAKEYNKAVTNFQKTTIAAWFFDFTGKLEGQANNFNVTNGVFETSFKIQSRVKNLFGKQGFFHFQVMLPGFEGGQTLRDPDEQGAEPATATGQALQEVDGIVRLKAGATFNAFWENPSPLGPLRRVELELGIVDRYLFLDEIRYDIATKTNNTVKHGNTYYSYADLKLFVAESSAGRYGIRISYDGGRLPPVYAPVKSFQFGFLFESNN